MHAFFIFQVITTKYSDLKPVTDRLLDIYFMLSAGKHDNDGSEDSVGKFLSHDGRLISTRYIEKKYMY